MRNTFAKIIFFILLLNCSDSFSKTISYNFSNLEQLRHAVNHVDSSDKAVVRALVSMRGNHVHFGLIFKNNKNVQFHHEEIDSPYHDPAYVVIHWDGRYNDGIRVHYGPLAEVKNEFTVLDPEVMIAVSNATVEIEKKNGTYFYLFWPLLNKSNIGSCSEFSGLLLSSTDFDSKMVEFLLGIANHARDRDFKNRAREQFFNWFTCLDESL